MRLAVGWSLVALVALVPVAASGSADVVASTQCTLQGKAGLSGTVYSAATGGAPLVQLGFRERRVEVRSLPSDTAKGRAEVSLRRDAPGIRVEGWLAADALRLASKSELVVVADHVAIRPGAQLRVLAPQPGDLFAEPQFASFAKVRAPVACGDLVLGASLSIPNDPRPSKGYTFKSKSTALYDQPGGKPVFTLDLLGSLSSYELEIRETKGAWHHFQSGGSERIDGWLRAQDLAPIKEGGDGALLGALGALALKGFGAGGSSSSRMVALRDTAVRLQPDAKSLVVAVLEKGAGVRAFVATPGFVQFHLEDADVTPPEGKEFFAASADLSAQP